jgi:hypothetical protein
MAVKVVDASAVAALLFGEPEADAIAGRLDDARLVAPGLLAFELANVCLVKMCRHPDERSGLWAAFRLRARPRGGGNRGGSRAGRGARSRKRLGGLRREHIFFFRPMDGVS